MSLKKGLKLKIPIVLFCLTLLFFPFITKAGLAKEIGKWMVKIAVTTMATILNTIARLVLFIAISILNWILSETFISWSYTNPATNPVINIGWTLTKNIANMAFVVLLAFVGLGTALRLKEYELQKLLPRMIFAIFLVYFSPVICGLIVDASNIVISFFLGQLGGLDSIGEFFNTEFNNIYQSIESGADIVAVLVRIIFVFITSLWTTFIIYILAFIFMLRYIAIWILVILAPLAFIAYVLPQTRGLWVSWWQWFIQWATVGIYAIFFLYLGNYIMLNAANIFPSPFNPEASDETMNWFVSFLQIFLPYGVAIAFLNFGTLLALSGGARSAELAVGTAQGLARKGAGVVGRKAKAFWGKRGEGIASRLENPSRWGERFFQRAKKAGGVKGAALSVLGYASRGVGLGVSALGVGVVGKKLRTSVTQARQSTISNVEEQAKKAQATAMINPEAVAAEYNMPFKSFEERMGLALGLVQAQGDKGLDQAGLRSKVVKLVKKGLKHPVLKEYASQIITRAPQLIEELTESELEAFVGALSQSEQQMLRQVGRDAQKRRQLWQRFANEKAARMFRRADIASLSPNSFNERFLEALLSVKGAEYFFEALEHHPNVRSMAESLARRISFNDLLSRNPMLRAQHSAGLPTAKQLESFWK